MSILESLLAQSEAASPLSMIFAAIFSLFDKAVNQTKEFKTVEGSDATPKQVEDMVNYLASLPSTRILAGIETTNIINPYVSLQPITDNLNDSSGTLAQGILDATSILLGTTTDTSGSHGEKLPLPILEKARIESSYKQTMTDRGYVKKRSFKSSNGVRSVLYFVTSDVGYTGPVIAPVRCYTNSQLLQMFKLMKDGVVAHGDPLYMLALLLVWGTNQSKLSDKDITRLKYTMESFIKGEYSSFGGLELVPLKETKFKISATPIFRGEKAKKGMSNFGTYNKSVQDKSGRYFNATQAV